MKNWQEQELVWKRSEKEAPFCPLCNRELDNLSLVNHTDTCGCGEWTLSGDWKPMYVPRKQSEKETNTNE